MLLRLRWLIFWALAGSFSHTEAISKIEKSNLRNEAKDSFFHAFNNYMTYAYPADELKPLSCAGRYRGREASRGDVDDALGHFAMTLVDSLDTLPVLGAVREFSEAIHRVINEVSFGSDVVVSVFETNIRVLGGLLGAHTLALSLKQKGEVALSWYNGELLSQAQDLGDRLLPAFNSPTGIPYARVNLKYGLTDSLKSTTTTCTACGGSMILEFAALSRLLGNSTYELVARKGMDAIWQRRSPHLLVGTTIDVNSGEWREQDSGVGAGIDSYYEYCLKAYVLLGDAEYLDRFKKHYSSIMRFVRRGTTLLDVNMYSPLSVAQHFVDALSAFWPGLQVLAGDVSSAVELHASMERIVNEHKFMPEAYSVEGNPVWAHHFLRPEYAESTYFLYQATKDDHYLEVGKSILENLKRYARVDCGFAAFSDLRSLAHEDRMDSFVLSETFKYLYLLFSEKEDLLLNMDDYIFSTEAHLLPISLSLIPSGIPGAMSNDDFMLDDVCHRAVEKEAMAHRYSPDLYRRSTDEQSSKSHQPRDPQCRPVPTNIPLRLLPENLDVSNDEHVTILKEMGISIVIQSQQQVQLLHNPANAKSGSHADEGLVFMHRLIEHNAKLQKAAVESVNIKVVKPTHLEQVLVAGTSHFGPDLKTMSSSELQGDLVLPDPRHACAPITNEVSGRIALVQRGSCMFVDKVLNAELAGAKGAIIYDSEDSGVERLVSMTGNGSKVAIPSAFLLYKHATSLVAALVEGTEVTVGFDNGYADSTSQDNSNTGPHGSEAKPVDTSPLQPDTLDKSNDPEASTAESASSETKNDNDVDPD